MFIVNITGEFIAGLDILWTYEMLVDLKRNVV
jgi:hypothetical protein